MKKIKFIAIFMLVAILLCGCGKDESEFGNLNPEKHFKNCDISVMSVHTDTIYYDGFEIRSDDAEGLEKLYRNYIKLCENDSNWPSCVYSSEIYWTHENEDGTKQFTANYYPEKKLVEVFIKINLTNKEEEKDEE